MKRFRNILFVTDAVEQERLALERVTALAESSQARLTVLTVLDEVPPPGAAFTGTRSPAEVRDAVQQQAMERLAVWIGPVRERVAVETQVLFGRLFLEVIRDVLRNGRDLVMKTATADGGLRTALFGSTDMHLLRKCPCPLWLMKPGGPTPYKRILAAVDFDPLEAVSAPRRTKYPPLWRRPFACTPPPPSFCYPRRPALSGHRLHNGVQPDRAKFSHTP